MDKLNHNIKSALDHKMAMTVEITTGNSWSILYKEMATINKNTIPIYLNNSIDNFTIQGSNLELDALTAMNEFGTSIVVSSLLASVLVGTYYKYPIYRYMYDNSDEVTNKPVDLLILFQAIVEHLACIVMVTFLSVGMVFDISFASYFGEMWCFLPWNAASFGVAYRTIGSLGIAILRLIHIKRAGQSDTVPGYVKWIVLLACIVVTILVTIGYGLGNGPASRKQVIWNFCIGSSEALRKSVYDYSLARGLVKGESDLISNLALSIPAFGVLAEFGCYLFFFYHLYSHDEGMVTRKILPAIEVRKRHRKNAITFLGQFYCFLVELAITIGFFYTMQETTKVGNRACLLVGLWVEFGILSVIEVMTSTTLKTNLPHNRFFRRT